jgi:sugar O-acyltransferase (sialic acid O-acetyltransferase NeuD family)
MTSPCKSLNKVLVIGCGDLGRLLAHHVLNTPGWELAGFVDDTLPLGTPSSGSLVLGCTNDVKALASDGVCNTFLLGIGYKHLQARQTLFERFSEFLPAAPLIHPTACLDPSAKIGPGCVLFPRSIIDSSVVLEANVLVNTAALICHHGRIGAHSFIGPAACIAGFAKIGRRCFIGINSTIRDNVRVADDITIGAGAVVVGHLLSAGTYIGVPAQKIEPDKPKSSHC